MIKPEELRLGNIINKGIVQGIDDVHGVITEQEYDIKFEDCEPIPLTEEWLLRMGFVRGKEDTDRNVYYGKGKQLFDIMFNTRGHLLYKTVVVHTPIEYVHQMQNLIYALTGTELTIK